MELHEAIQNRRSIRNYTLDRVERSAIDTLLEAAVQAPSAMNSQPWGFVVIQDEQRLKKYSDQAKQLLLSSMDKFPVLVKYQNTLSNPEFNIFYNASTLIILCSRNEVPSSFGDCCLAAQNIMLTAHAIGLGTCWIGFATNLLNQPEVKPELNIPDDFTIVAPIIVGHPQVNSPAFPKNPPKIFSWL